MRRIADECNAKAWRLVDSELVYTCRIEFSVHKWYPLCKTLMQSICCPTTRFVCVELAVASLKDLQA